MADRAVMRGDVKIQNAQDLYNFCNEQLTTVKSLVDVNVGFSNYFTQ